MVNDEEQISALVDAELEAREAQALLDRLSREPALQERWSRYHLISDALRKNLPPAVPADFSARVSRALEQEPTLLAPSPRRIPDLGRKVASVALAASVSAVAILAVQRLGSDEPEPAAMVAGAEPPSGVGVRGPAPDPRLSPYLVNHNEYSKSGMHGMLPYVRMVSQEGGR